MHHITSINKVFWIFIFLLFRVPKDTNKMALESHRSIVVTWLVQVRRNWFMCHTNPTILNLLSTLQYSKKNHYFSTIILGQVYATLTIGVVSLSPYPNASHQYPPIIDITRFTIVWEPHILISLPPILSLL